MLEKIRLNARRLALLALGVALTSTAGHAAARMMAVQIAQERPSYAFELAVLITFLLAMVHIAAFYFKRPVKCAKADASPAGNALPVLMPQTAAAPVAPSPAIARLKLPPGLRLDSNEALMITSGGHPDRQILYVNGAFARLTGFSAGEWIGRNGDLLLADGPLQMESLLWLDAEADGREVHWIARLHRRDGTPFCAEAHLHPMTGADGRISHVVVVMTDVTSRVGNGKSRDRGTDSATGNFETRKTA